MDNDYILDTLRYPFVELTSVRIDNVFISEVSFGTVSRRFPWCNGEFVGKEA